MSQSASESFAPSEDRDDPLAPLLVLDRLEVGPVKVDRDRLSMPYRVTRGTATEETELVYRYEEVVFEEGDGEPAARLAGLIGAQVALNYGLCCRQIVFRGAFDASARRFLEAMLENTAREIYVNKILGDNPFLTRDIRELPFTKRRSYVLGELLFSDPLPIDDKRGGEKGERWEASADRWAVLSSGGKDSLLSFGLLRELGCEVHPIFVNESGRHWFTALNAYRHFEAEVPHTARVWTNADRIFTWMLRQLPFVRSDFQRQRTDIYPIRLWTVAVFVFGALPLLRKRGISRLVVGDEHDTTVRRSHRGIPHYDGLYDQSRHFDHALSRFFASQGWRVVQLSLLRPLSELLIEKTLASRYPDLLPCQTSCHATHAEGERMVPCGRCEKCRRIVAMLLALDVDPGLLSYGPEQVKTVLAEIESKGIHQETAGTAQLATLLAERGLIGEPKLGSVRGAPHPEILSLRFHPERSPIEEVPLSLRHDLYRLLLEQADGAVRRLGRQWVPLDLETEPVMAAPSPFERPRSKPAQHTYLWGELKWPEAKDVLKSVDIALLPVGAIEQHGPHLPLDTDSFDADYLVRCVAEACRPPRPLALPLIPYGVSYHHDDFPGTLSVTNETLARFVYEIGMGVARNGIRKLVIVNGHGGNSATLHFAAQMINRDSHIFTCVDTGESSDHDVMALSATPNDVHAGEIETSTTLATRPELVDMDAARPFVPRFSNRYLDFTTNNSVGWYARTSKISESGVFGDPTKASRKKGEEMWQLMIHHLVELVEHLKGLTLEEIYERRS